MPVVDGLQHPGPRGWRRRRGLRELKAVCRKGYFPDLTAVAYGTDALAVKLNAEAARVARDELGGFSVDGTAFARLQYAAIDDLAVGYDGNPGRLNRGETQQQMASFPFDFRFRRDYRHGRSSGL